MDDFINNIYFRICILSLICLTSSYNCLYGIILGFIFIFIISHNVYNNINKTHDNIKYYYKYDNYLKNI